MVSVKGWMSYVELAGLLFPWEHFGTPTLFIAGLKHKTRYDHTMTTLALCGSN